MRRPDCSVPSSWGGTFLLVCLLVTILYLSGGAQYASKVQGKTFRGQHSWIALLPHHVQWVGAFSLVTDGCSFTRAELSKRWSVRSDVASSTASATAKNADGLLANRQAITKASKQGEQGGEDEQEEDTIVE